ncbi:hypothetical protein ACFVRB_43320 [Streptomyces nojiriensis]|uniref:hypothetical protein n=1 Tax=Streptomyces nojiriensis TaxID=66374 RepID=UPI0036DC97F1
MRSRSSASVRVQPSARASPLPRTLRRRFARIRYAPAISSDTSSVVGRDMIYGEAGALGEIAECQKLLSFRV